MAMVCTSSADDSLMAGNTMTGDAKLFCQLALALPALQQVPGSLPNPHGVSVTRAMAASSYAAFCGPATHGIRLDIKAAGFG